MRDPSTLPRLCMGHQQRKIEVMAPKSLRFGSYFSATKVVDDVQMNAALIAAEIQNKAEAG